MVITAPEWRWLGDPETTPVHHRGGSSRCGGQLLLCQLTGQSQADASRLTRTRSCLARDLEVVKPRNLITSHPAPGGES